MDDMMDFPDELPERPRTVAEEVYRRFYLPDCSGQANEDMFAYCHPNGLVVIGITHLHPLAGPGAWAPSEEDAEEEEQQEQDPAGPRAPPDGEDAHPPVVDFSSKRTDFAAAKVSGKKAGKGGAMLQPETVVCRVTPPGGGGRRCFKLRALVRGFMLEANARLQAEPELLRTSPQQDGFLAILKLQGGGELDRIQASPEWLSAAEYAKLRGVPESSLA